MKQITTISTQTDERETVIQTDGVKIFIKSAGVSFVLDFSGVSTDSPEARQSIRYSGVTIGMMQKNTR